MIAFKVGQTVKVAHGVSGWTGTVAYVSPGSLIVNYPNGNRPGDDMPARELVNLSRRKVVLV